MQIAIVEDIENDSRELIKMLKSYFQNKNISADWTCYSSGQDFLDSHYPGRYDLVFLDIYMDGINGMDLSLIHISEPTRPY